MGWLLVTGGELGTGGQVRIGGQLRIGGEVQGHGGEVSVLKLKVGLLRRWKL